MYLRPDGHRPDRSRAYTLFGLLCGIVWAWLCAELLLRL
jgi:hypothetical protein